MEAELKKKNILRGSPYIVDAALAGVKAVIKNASNKNISKQDEMIRQRNLERSKKSIKAENIAADGRNFHNAIINDNKFRSKLNKTLKELLNLELLIVTPKFLKELLQDPQRYKRFRTAQRSGMMYPVGMSRYSRTKFIMLRDLKFKMWDAAFVECKGNKTKMSKLLGYTNYQTLVSQMKNTGYIWAEDR